MYEFSFREFLFFSIFNLIFRNHKNNDIVFHFRNIQCRYLYFLQYTKQNRFLYTIRSYTEFDWFSFNGVDGSRTRVQKQIPCTSTSVVCDLTFPPRYLQQTQLPL